MEASKDGLDPERVVELRRQSLVRAGYKDDQARALAERLDLDLQTVLAPRKQGLPPDVAFEIAISGGGRTVF